MRFRPDSTRASRQIAYGIDAAHKVIEATPLPPSRVQYLDTLAAALEREKERWRADPDDEDGWGLGGISTILNRIEEERRAAGPFEIRFDTRTEKEAAHYVSRKFFAPAELPAALARMLTTSEFWLFLGVPIALLTLWESDLGTLIAVAWLLGGLIVILRYGRVAGIACYLRAGDGKRLVGAVRLRLDRGKRTVWIAGLFTEPEFRGRGLATALMLAVLRLVLREARAGGRVTLKVFAPAHPASRAIVRRYLDGAPAVDVTDPPEGRVAAMAARIEAACAAADINWVLAEGERPFFP